MGKSLQYHNEILQLRAEAVKLNKHRYVLRRKMEDAGMSGIAIRQAIGFLSVEIEYASDYEEDMYVVWHTLNEKQGVSVQAVDAALIRSNVSPMELCSHLNRGIDTELTRRFFAELEHTAHS